MRARRVSACASTVGIVCARAGVDGADVSREDYDKMDAEMKEARVALKARRMWRFSPAAPAGRDAAARADE